MISKLANIKGQWQWVVLSDEEVEKIREQHFESSRKLMDKCLAVCFERAKQLVIEDKWKTCFAKDMAMNLFEKNCEALNAVMMKEMDNAILALVKA